eukprot:TRINITY_DN1980_c0_g1_i4.p1 TRINITY_DN1980_c0_g1~~TRINITY_DN1980_c0_g1_i4.p1  ORF type:complete len:341 (-),score=74.49 TRINITY_DN1980_c0_g1_i4:252-1274(-)
MTSAAARSAARRLSETVPSNIVEDIYRFSFKKQTGVSLKNVMAQGEHPTERNLLLSARFLHHELPVRLVQRVAKLKNLPYGLSTKIPALKVRNFCFDSFKDIRSFPEVRATQDVLIRDAGVSPTLSIIESALGCSLDMTPLLPQPPPLLIVISGPSGVGKDAVIRRLQEVRPELQFVVTATTRARRPGEEHGRDYFFVSHEEFEQMVKEGELLEHALVYGEYKGIPKQQIRESLTKATDVVRLDVQGAATVRSMVGSSAIFIFIVAESEAALVSRLVERKTESIDKLLVRVQTAREEMKRLHEFDYIVVNPEGEMDVAVNTIISIIDAEKSRLVNRKISL